MEMSPIRAYSAHCGAIIFHANDVMHGRCLCIIKLTPLKGRFTGHAAPIRFSLKYMCRTPLRRAWCGCGKKPDPASRTPVRFSFKMTKFSKMFDTLNFCCTNLVHSQHLTETQHWYIKRIFLGTGTGEPSGLKPDDLAARNRIGASRLRLKIFKISYGIYCRVGPTYNEVGCNDISLIMT